MTDGADTSSQVSTSLFIGGKPKEAAESLAVPDPGKPGHVVGYAAAASPQDVGDAVASARSAFPEWSALSAQERARLMAAAIEGIEEERDTDAAILSQENGKIVHEAWVDALVFQIRWQLALSLADEVDTGKTLAPAPGIPVTTQVRYQPLGVAAVIVPFNWPIAILGASLPHALLAGNTAVVKPPPTAPLATTRVVRRVAEKLPPGVLNVVTGDDANMTALIRDTDKVCFTGSVNGGKKIMEMAAPSLTRVTLELGGNDPAVVLDDAPLDDTHLDRLFSAIFDSTGQICMNVKRVHVHRTRMQEVVDGLAARLHSAVVGYGLDAATTMGPLHSPAQKTFVEELVREAREAGAEVREFSALPTGEDVAGGNYVRPAIVVDPDPGLRVVTEEQFGPVIPVLPFDTDEEAVERANDTWAGLGASVWSADQARADALATRIAAGYVWINDHGATRLDLRAPFGGVKQSGIGREQGIEGVRAFQETHSTAVLDEQALADQAH